MFPYFKVVTSETLGGGRVVCEECKKILRTGCFCLVYEDDREIIVVTEEKTIPCTCGNEWHVPFLFQRADQAEKYLDSNLVLRGLRLCLKTDSLEL